jgi:predicted dehydrogenase
MDNMLRIGIVDTGFVARLHLDGFAAVPRCEVVGVTRTWYGDDANQQRQRDALKSFANERGIKAFESFDTMVESSEIDAVVITSINPYHERQVHKALDCGKHVLIEKPVVQTVEALKALISKTQTTGLKLMPAHNFTYRGAVLEAKRVLVSGQLGDVQYASFSQSFYASAIEGKWRSEHAKAWGGSLMDSGTHLVYQLLHLLGQPVKVQAMTSRNILTMEDEDIASVQVLMPSGAIVHLMQNWGSAHGEDIEGIRIIGTQGRLSISDALYVNGQKVNDDTQYPDSFKNQAHRFVAYVLDGQLPESDLDDAMMTLQIIDAAYHSARSDSTITLSLQELVR